MVLVEISSKDYELSFKEAGKISTYLKSNLDKESIILGPSMASMFKVNNIYHLEIIIKYRKDDNLKRVLKYIDDIYKTNNKVFVEIDFDPIKI